MHTARVRAALAISSTFLLGSVASLLGCGGASPGADARSDQIRQPDTTAAPIWTVNYQGSPGLSYKAAAVDDDGNTYIAAFTPQGGDITFLHKYDVNGGFLYRTVIGSDEFEVHALRANSVGAVTASTSFQQGGHIRIQQFTPDGRLVFNYHSPAPTSDYGGGVDICGDGTTVFVERDSGAPPALIDLSTSGAVQWSAPLAGFAVSKVRCYGNGQIVVGGTVSGSPALALFESDGMPDATWTSTDTGAAIVGFDRNDGIMYVGTTEGGRFAVYAVDTSGTLQWTWMSDGPSDALAGIAATDVITVAGTRTAGGVANDYVVQLDTTGAVLWSREAPISGGGGLDGVAVDGADRAFFCDSNGTAANAALYDTDGGTVWTASGAPAQSVSFVDVTNGVARCVGTASGLAIVAFQVE